MKSRLWTVLLPFILLLGCSAPEKGAQEGTASEDVASSSDRVMAWSCNGTSLVTTFDDSSDSVVLQHPDGTVELAHVQAASGAKYSDGAVTFWTKGEEALYEPGDGETHNCVIDRYRTGLEAARLAGYQFRAVGNEPGWMLLIGRDRIVWETDYGETRYEIEAPEPVSPDDSSTVWQTRVGGEPWSLTLREGPCFDDMSGEEFPTAVQIDFGERTYRGCGQPLR